MKFSLNMYICSSSSRYTLGRTVKGGGGVSYKEFFVHFLTKADMSRLFTPHSNPIFCTF